MHLEGATAGNARGMLASAKDVYMLAHEYELAQLAQLALFVYSRQLEPGNVLDELFSDSSYAYDELRQAGLKMLKANWMTVKESDSFKRFSEAVVNGSADPLQTAVIALQVCQEI